MGRPQRAALGEYVYHVLNRANVRMTVFRKDADYEASEKPQSLPIDPGWGRSQPAMKRKEVEIAAKPFGFVMVWCVRLGPGVSLRSTPG